ncbi:response regulator [Photobacterium sp. SDRW27]|uniref:response regulator n=1 Tax=Photobacterium obscurum TaxID=2829490 RepID=UPI002243B0EB|nr:response regulator [Photobacterium obscurum]MCW8328351.1 response regulator [Photobacterium obscurum]
MEILAQSTYLIIDDSNIIQSATRALLIKLGVPMNNIISTASAKGAIAACNQRKFDILLIDHNLGSGSTGLHLLEFLRYKEVLKQQALVFIVTGNDSQDVFLGYSQLEPDGYLIKPIRSDDIIKRVSSGLLRREYCQNLEQAFNRNGLAEVKPLFTTAPDTIALKSGILHIANLLCKNQQFDEAQAMLAGLLQLHNHLPARIKQTEILLEKKQHQAAREHINSLIEQNKSNVRLLNIKTEICIEAERWADAEETIQRALQLHSSSIEQTLNMAWLHIACGDLNKAVPYLLQVAHLLPYSMWDNSGRRGLSIYADMQGIDNDKLPGWRADAAWYRVSKGNQSNLTSKATQKAIQALRLIELGKSKEAADLLSQILENEITDFETGYLICLAHRELGQHSEIPRIKQQLNNCYTPTTRSLSRLQSIALNELERANAPSQAVTG